MQNSLFGYEPSLFPYEWKLSDGYPADGIAKNGLKIFGTFISGGGSTMGYKLAGFEHLGGVEIDKKLCEVYKKNHAPKYLYNEDIRHFHQRTDLPAELFDLDILDGSPPCSSFSMAGNREKDWGKEKKFAEGQALQTLDDLFFEYIKLADKLCPKVCIAENVTGIFLGNAFKYVQKIYAKFDAIGYDVKHYVLDSSLMGVPQKRKRVFFVCTRKDLKIKPDLKLNFNQKPILFGNFIEKTDYSDISNNYKFLWDNRKDSDVFFSDINLRLFNKKKDFNLSILHKNRIPYTITTRNIPVTYDYPRRATNNELIKIGSFPLDYNFSGVRHIFLIGMSVPPVMMAQFANQIAIQLFKK